MADAGMNLTAKKVFIFLHTFSISYLKLGVKSTMNKSELINAIAKASGISKAAAARSLDAFIKTISDVLSKGGRVALPGFGSFDIGKRKKRMGRNPRTGQVITIPAAKVPKFKAGKNLKDRVK